MFKNLSLTRPLAVIDLETTGVDPQSARIVEIGVIKIDPAGGQVQRTRRLNPGIPIPPDATAVHGIYDIDVADKPAFSDIAASLHEFLSGCDLCGYNLKRFDLRILHEEFKRAGVPFDLEGRALVDPMEMFHQMEPRHLAAAVRFYLNRDHDNAHTAHGDVQATLEVLDAMLDRYADLPRTPDGLHVRFRDPNVVDSGGFFTRVEGEIRFKKGKHRGQPLDAVAQREPDYLRWMLAGSFLDDTKAVAANALNQSATSNLV
jgi:DNA polymerase-3 subunit epsilon